MKKTVEKLLRHPLVKLYLNDKKVRLHITLLRSLISGLLYAAFNLFSAIRYGNSWFGVVSVYYVLIIITRYILFLTNKNSDEATDTSCRAYRNCRTVGIIMLILNGAMALMIVYTVITSRAQNHSEIVIYALAAYSATVLSFNVASIIRNRRHVKAPAFLVTRIIALSAALMSFFNLLNSIVYKYGMRASVAIAVNATVGVFVIFAVLIMSVAVIYKCNKRIRVLTKSAPHAYTENSG